MKILLTNIFPKKGLPPPGGEGDSAEGTQNFQKGRQAPPPPLGEGVQAIKTRLGAGARPAVAWDQSGPTAWAEREGGQPGQESEASPHCRRGWCPHTVWYWSSQVATVSKMESRGVEEAASSAPKRLNRLVKEMWKRSIPGFCPPERLVICELSEVSEGTEGEGGDRASVTVGTPGHRLPCDVAPVYTHARRRAHSHLRPRTPTH